MALPIKQVRATEVGDLISVTIVGGYLGAGKTTLVNHILANADQRVAVMVNDFGEVNIDADLIRSRDGDTISLANGCICCSMVDGFGAALQTITEAPVRPERLVIEASGVGYPGQIAGYAHTPGLKLDGVVVVVDAETIRANLRSEYIGDVVRQQCVEADLIVLNKVDLVANPDAVEKAVRKVADVSVVQARSAHIPLGVLIGLDRSGLEPSGAPRSAQDRFRTWMQEFPDPVDRLSFLADLGSASDVLRAKGTVRFSEDPNTFFDVHVVGKRVTLTQSDRPWPTPRLVYIGLRTT